LESNQVKALLILHVAPSKLHSNFTFEVLICLRFLPDYLRLLGPAKAMAKMV